MAMKLTDPGELVASIPLMLGFAPVDSVVVVGLTSSGAMRPLVRADATDFAVADTAQALARSIAAHLSRARAARVVVIGFATGGMAASERAVIAARDALSCHMEVLDAWAVAGAHYRSPECADPGCCPDGGRHIPAAPAAVARAFAAPSHSARTPARAPANRRRKAQRAYDRSWAARSRDMTRWRRQRLEGWRSAVAMTVDGTTPSDAEVGKLAAGLRDVAVRDAIVVDLVPGEGSVAEALCADPSAPGVREALAVMLLPASAAAPRGTAVTAVDTLAHHLAWLCPRDVTPAMTILGLMRWWHGDESGAAHAVARALDHTADYRLALLVKCAIDAHMPPGWLAAA